jgi:hypothetical protein
VTASASPVPSGGVSCEKTMVISYASGETIPSESDIARIADFCVSLLDELWAFRNRIERVRPPIKLLLPGMHVPSSFVEAIGIFWLLADFEDARLLETIEPPLPTIECLFRELRQTLQQDPKQFWTKPEQYLELAARASETYRQYNWQRFDDAPIATDTTLDDVFVEQLVDLLIALPDAPRPATLQALQSPKTTAILPFQLPKPKEYKFNQLHLAYGPPEDPYVFSFRPRSSKELRADYDYIVNGFAENGIELELTFEEFCAEVRPRRSKRKAKSTQQDS